MRSLRPRHARAAGASARRVRLPDGRRRQPRRGPTRSPPASTESAAELLAEHNRNAERDPEPRGAARRSSSAEPAGRRRPATASWRWSGRGTSSSTLRSRLGTTSPTSARTTSEFWFWVKDKHGEGRSTTATTTRPAPARWPPTFQPDWIIEALGLRVIPDEEAAEIKVTPGKDAGTLVLTQRQKTSQGESLIKETILDESTGRIREHWVYAADHKTLLAHAVVTDYQEYATPAGESGAPAETVYLPQKLRLEWIRRRSWRST